MVRTHSNSQFSGALLTGTILLANVDVTGLFDYGLKAFIGGAIWLGYKLTAEHIAERKRKQKKP